MPEYDEAVRAASDAIDAYCSVNPAPFGIFPAGQTMAERVAAIVEAAGFGPAPERVEVTYTPYRTPEEAFLESLTDERRQAIYRTAQEAAMAGHGSVDELCRALVSVMAKHGGADA